MLSIEARTEFLFLLLQLRAVLQHRGAMRAQRPEEGPAGRGGEARPHQHQVPEVGERQGCR